MFLCVQLNPSPYPTVKLWQSSTRGTRSNSFFKIRSACIGIIWKFYSTTTAMEVTQFLKNVLVLGSPENDFNTDWFLYNGKWPPVSYIHVLPPVARTFVSYYLLDFNGDFFLYTYRHNNDTFTHKQFNDLKTPESDRKKSYLKLLSISRSLHCSVG